MSELRLKTDFDISIIVCCYNGEATIEKCLNSLKNQKRENISIEVLLIDDGSKDGTSTKISNFLVNNSDLNNLQFKYYRKVNEGLSIARNYGISKSRSNIVAFIDEDAIADDFFALNIVRHFTENQRINAIGGKVSLLNTENSFANLIQNSIFSIYMKSTLSAIGTNMAFRKSFLYEIGGFQPEFTYRGDESALFSKAGNKLKLLQADDVKVKHPQPNNLNSWLKTKYENGYFAAAINSLIKSNDILYYKRIVISIITLSFPLFFFFFCIIHTTVSLILLSFYLLFLLKRFVFNSSTNKIIDEYYLNVHEKRKGKKVLYIKWVVFLGSLLSDYGYLKGLLKYRRYKWFLGNSLL